MISLNWLRYLRTRSFDAVTEDGRAAERYRLAAWAVLANIISKSMAMAVMVLSVSLTIPYLGAQRFGVWMTVASFATMLSLLGLGVGNALVNHVAGRRAIQDPVLLRQAITGGLGFLMLLGLVVGASLSMLAVVLPWDRIIRTDDAFLLMEARDAARLFAVLFGLSLLTTGIQSVFAGLQRNFEVHLVSALGSMVSLGALWLAAHWQAGIPVLLAASFGIPLLSTFCLLGLLVRRDLISLHQFRIAVATETPALLRIGGLFFVLQLGGMVGWGADTLIISSVLGPAQVAVYSVVQRLFQFVTQPLTMMNGPLWGAYADAHVKGDVKFIHHTLKLSMLATLGISLVGALILFAVSQQLLKYWTHGAVHVPVSLVGAMACWTVLDCCGSAFAMFLNGVRVVREQVIVVTMFCAVVLPLKLLGIHQMGLIAIPAAAVLVYATTHIYLYGFVFYPRIRSAVTTAS